MASSTAWKELLLLKKKTNKDSMNSEDLQEQCFRFSKVSGGLLRHYSAQLARFLFLLVESEKVYIETLDTALSACMHLSDIKNVGFEEFVERLTSFRNGSQEFLESMQGKNDEKTFISYITSPNFYKIYQEYISHFNHDVTKIQKAKNENSRLQIQLKDLDLYLNAPFRRAFYYRSIYWNILRCKNQKVKIDENKIIHSLNSLVNSILKCKTELNIENDDFVTIAKFEQDLDSSKVNVNGETMAIFTYLCNGINTSPIENTPNIINTYSLDKITIKNSDYEKSSKDNVTVTIFSDFLIITKDTYSQKSNKDNNNSGLKSQLLYPPIPLKEVSITERQLPKHLQKSNHVDNGNDSRLKYEEDDSALNYTDFVFELRCTNPQVFIVLQAENDEDREYFMNSVVVQKNIVLNNNQEIYFDDLGQFIVSSYKPKIPKINVEDSLSPNKANKKSMSNMTIDENSINEGAENNESVDLNNTDKSEMQSIATADDSSKFNNTTIFQAMCSPYYFKQNEWIKMPKSILYINKNSDGRHFITLNASATGRILLNEYICPDSVITQSSKNENVLQIKTKSRGLFSLRFGKYDTAAFNTLLNFSKELIKDSICWTYDKKEDLFLIEKSPSLDETYDMVIKNNIDDSTEAFKMYCEKTTKYEIIDQLYVKEGNNWVSLGLSKINVVIPNYIMETDIENTENTEEMDLLSQNSIEPIITAHSLTDNNKKQGSTPSSSLMCFLRAPINQDCIILKNKNIHDDNVYELNFMYEEKIFEYLIYSKKADNSLAFVSEYINKLSNYYSKILDEKYDPAIFDSTYILNEDKKEKEEVNEVEKEVKEEVKEKENVKDDNNVVVETEDTKENEDEDKKEDDDNESIDDDEEGKESSKNPENNLLSGFIFMSSNDKPLSSQTEQNSQATTGQNAFVFDMSDFSTPKKEATTEDKPKNAFVFDMSDFSTPKKETTTTADTEKDKPKNAFVFDMSDFSAPKKETTTTTDTEKEKPKNAFVFDMSDFSTPKKETTKTEEKNQNSTSIFSGFSLSTPAAPEEENDTGKSLFSNSKPLFSVPPMATNSFGFSFNKPETIADDESITMTSPLFSHTTSKASPLFNSTTTTTTSPLFGTNTTTAAAPIPFGISFSFTKNPSQTSNIIPDVKEETDKVVENLEEPAVDEITNKEIPVEEEKVEPEKSVEAELEPEKPVESELKPEPVPESEAEPEKPVEAKQDEEVVKEEESVVEKVEEKEENKDLKSNPLNESEYEAGMSCTLYDVSEVEPAATKNPEKEKLLLDTPEKFDYNDLKSGKLLPLRFDQVIRSCEDLCIGVNNIKVPIRGVLGSHQEMANDSIANLKNDIKRIHSILNDSETSILTYNGDVSNENLNLKKTKSISELEMKTIFKGYTLKKNDEIEYHKKSSRLQTYIDNYLDSVNNLSATTVKEEEHKEEKTVKNSKVANIVSTINNYIMKELNNENTTFEKSEKVKCLKLSPGAEGNLTYEQLLSLYIKNLRPVNKDKTPSGKDTLISTRKNVSTNNITDSNDSISSYYKYADNGKIEMTSTGNMNVTEAFDLLRYKIKILRKQLTIERKAREELAEDYMALKEELNSWIEKTESINENFIMERASNMEKDDYIQLLEGKLKMYENLINRHNEAYPRNSLPSLEDDDVLISISNH